METTSVSNFSLLDMDMTFEFIGYHFTCRDGVGGIVSGSVPISAYQPTLSLSALFHCLYSPYPITIVSSTQIIMLSSIVKRRSKQGGGADYLSSRRQRHFNYLLILASAELICSKDRSKFIFRMGKRRQPFLASRV